MSFAADLSYAFRQIRRRPGLPLVIVLCLGLAQGINASLFSFVSATWFAPWHVPDVDGLRVVLPSVSQTEWRDWAEQTTSFSGLAAQHYGSNARLAGRRVAFDFVSANYFRVLGIPLQLGRGFSSIDDAVDATGNSAVVSHWFWQERLGGDPNVVGRSIALDPLDRNIKSVPLMIVGVAAPGFDGPDGFRRQLWLPLAAIRQFQAPGNPRLNQGAVRELTAFGRLARDASSEQAQAELTTLRGRMPLASGVSRLAEAIRVRRTDRLSQSPPTLQTALTMSGLLIGVAFVTLIACANVSNLLLARAYSRRGEIAIRFALGASRVRIVCQLLTESLLLALAAGWLGLMIAWWLPDTVLRAVFQSLSPDFAEIVRLTFPIDRRLFAWVLAMSFVAVVAFGLWPALRCTEASVGDGLKEGQGSAGTALLSSLLGYQTIVSVMALAIGGLILRSEPVAEARQIDRSFAGLAVVRLVVPPELNASQGQALIGSITERLEAVAGGRNVAGLTGQIQPGVNQSLHVTSDYFRVLGIPWVIGRTFDPADPTDGVMVVNDAFAHHFWPGEAAVGQSLAPDDVRVWDPSLTGRRVVGVVRDAQRASLTAFLPTPPGDVRTFLVRGSEHVVAREMATLIAGRSPSVTVQVLSGTAWVAPIAGPSLISAYLAMAFGAVALLLGTVGLFSLLEYTVRQRTREIGIRIALGAEPQHIVKAILAPGSRALLNGLLMGSGGAVCAGFVMRRAELPAGINPIDLVTYAGVATVLLLAGSLASCVPARRAIHIEPSEALRVD